jgi:phosphonatase-like hydrolase
MRIELVVFDLAGTTVYDGDAVNACFRAALAGAGLAVDAAAVNAVMGLPKPEAIRRLIEASTSPTVAHADLAAIHADFVARMSRYYATDPAVREMPGASATFAALRRAGIKIALNTGFSRPITRVLLDRLGWVSADPPIDATVTSDEVPRGRPFSDMIQNLMRRFGISDAARVAKVGDTPADLEEGINAGCGLVIGVTTGTHSRVQLERHPHTHLVDSVADIPRILGIADTDCR